jgi:4-hydroxy-tetrahydrodipicolinate synthase
MGANFIETNPIPAKAALAMMGLIEENYRLPLVSMAPDNRARLETVLVELGLIETTE